MSNIYKLQLRRGFIDNPDRVYLINGKKRHWITDPHVFIKCGLRWEFVQAVNAKDDIVEDGRAVSTVRDLLAYIYLRGSGIEIGALNNPSVMPFGAYVKYIDYLSVEKAKKIYPHLAAKIEMDLTVDDGEVLSTVADGILDFIVANHFLEHTRNPLGVLRVHLRKLRVGGKLLYALPDKRHTFDVKRPITSFDHNIVDDTIGVHTSERGHYLEFAELVDNLDSIEAIEQHATVLQNMDNRIHFHVWDARAAKEFFDRGREYLGRSFDLLEFVEAVPELVAVIEKRA